jgi:hypothetical protein
MPAAALRLPASITRPPATNDDSDPSKPRDDPFRRGQTRPQHILRRFVLASVMVLAAPDFRVREDEVDQEPLTIVPKLTPVTAKYVTLKLTAHGDNIVNIPNDGDKNGLQIIGTIVP